MDKEKETEKISSQTTRDSEFQSKAFPRKLESPVSFSSSGKKFQRKKFPRDLLVCFI
jgi:hypothetical protein